MAQPTYDIALFSQHPTDPSRSVSTSSFSTPQSGNFLTGVRKLAQLWIVEFLTDLGSMGFHNANRGTRFVKRFQAGAIVNEIAAQAEFAFAAAKVAESLARLQPSDAPLDEQLANVELLGLVVQPGAISLSVKINSNAGTTAVVSTPINVLPSLAITE